MAQLMLAYAACVCLVLMCGGLRSLNFCIMAPKCTLYPSVTFPKHRMMFMERWMNIGRCVECDEIVHNNIHVHCLLILCLFILLCFCNVHVNKKADILK